MSLLWNISAFTQMGFNFSESFTKNLTSRSSDRKEVTVDEFIVLCITIQRLTEAFRVRDSQQNGVINIGFEDFLNVVLTNTNWILTTFIAQKCLYDLIYVLIFNAHPHSQFFLENRKSIVDFYIKYCYLSN